MKIFSLIAVITAFLFLSVNAQTDFQQKIDRIDELCNSSLALWNVPGMSIAIVKNGEIVFAEGYGVRDINTKEKVDANTLFSVASNTKTFTATAIGILVEEGKMNWNDKVVDYLPWFKLYDPYVTQNITIRDLLCHRSGLATFSGDLIWYGSNYSRREVIERAQYLKPIYGFRERFGYSNILFLTAGEIVAKVSGMSWDEFIKKHFFSPIGMDRTITSTKDLEGMNNISSPHNILENDEVIAIDYLNWDNIAPAGSIISSANDMAQWIILHLNKGKTDKENIFSTKTQEEMWQLQTPSNISSFARELWPSTHFKGYGMGWSLLNYHGKRIVGHNGGYDGMISQTTIIPEENMGFVILTNANSSMYYPLMYYVLDILLTEENTDWNSLFHNYSESQKIADIERNIANEEMRIKDSKPSLELKAYTGTYHSEVYGEAEISFKEEALYFNMLESDIFESDMTHWQYNTFSIKFSQVPSLPLGTINFLINAEGSVYEMQVDVPNPDFDFMELVFIKE